MTPCAASERISANDCAALAATMRMTSALLTFSDDEEASKNLPATTISSFAAVIARVDALGKAVEPTTVPDAPAIATVSTRPSRLSGSTVCFDASSAGISLSSAL